MTKQVSKLIGTGGLSMLLGAISLMVSAQAPHVPAWAHNHLLDAKVSGNMESYDQGLRGKADHVVYDLEAGKFQQKSGWHEYGIGAGKTLGVVKEEAPVWWMAEWQEAVTSNLIVLRGCYPNQPQPDTAWKIELRSGETWREHDRGVGGWYDDGFYEWRVPLKEAVAFDGMRVSLFSKDEASPLSSVHFRGEEGTSWVVAEAPDLDARLDVSKRRIRLGETLQFNGHRLAGTIKTWDWDFGDGQSASGASVAHDYEKQGTYVVRMTFADGTDTATLKTSVVVGSPVVARITPLAKALRADDTLVLDGSDSHGTGMSYAWDLGDGTFHQGARVEHRYAKPGKYTVKLTVQQGDHVDDCTALIRVHDEHTLGLPQLLLDSDQKNEQDDQYFLGYAIFSELDLLGINSVHHGGGQEAENYEEILHVIDLAKQSGAAERRLPQVFRGADVRLEVPASGAWEDTMPLVNEATEAILAAARGASPENPAWIVPVGPGTNVASAILLAREEGLELSDRIRVMWLGGSDKAITQEFNGNNDPWSLYVIGQSGVPLWIMPAPVGARVRIDKRTESDHYADHPLGHYLEKITPATNKALYDPAVLGAIIDIYEARGWVKEVEFVTVNGPDASYEWSHSDKETPVKVIREIDQDAIKADIFNTINGTPTPLRK